MENCVFRFKHFSVSHIASSMKVGVDGVLIGAWAGETATKILDAGTGCGLISLMMAQRFSDSQVDAIDIDEGSVEEARNNFTNSEWSRRLKVKKVSFIDLDTEKGELYDLIVSNPPFYSSGITNPGSPREKARHQHSLSPYTLLSKGSTLITDEGRISFICPSEIYKSCLEEAENHGMMLIRSCFVRNREGKSFKRVMLEFGKKLKGMNACEIREEELTMFKDNEPTQEYRDLCKEFYLKF